MLSKFEKKIAEFIKSEGLFGSDDRVLLAVSGGADSTALLHVMSTLKAGGEIFAAHMNHQLRGADSDGDEEFVIAEAKKLRIDVTTMRLDVKEFAKKNKLSIETAARRLRIMNLLAIAKAKKCNVIVTAHHKDDNAETMIQRLSRGTGFRGLGGIWPVQEFGNKIRFVRPLLCIRRKKIIEYLKKRGLKWREDKTNKDCRYRRNFIRHRLIPQLQKDSQICIAEQLDILAGSARRFHKLICRRVDEVWSELSECGSGRVTLYQEKLKSETRIVKAELIRQSLLRLGSGERDLKQKHYDRILQLADENVSGKQIELPAGFIVWRQYEDLVFAKTKASPRDDERTSQIVELQIPGRTRFSGHLIEASILNTEVAGGAKFKAGKNSFIEWFDFEKLSQNLTIRFRRQGDKFQPLGVEGEKKVGKFLTDSKVLPRIRKGVMVVCANETIIWVWPIRISEQAKVTELTKKILQLQITDVSK